MKLMKRVIAIALVSTTLSPFVAVAGGSSEVPFISTRDGYGEIKNNLFNRTDLYAVKMQKQIAHSYETGTNGFYQDKTLAKMWYEAAFRNGDAYSGYKVSLIAKNSGDTESFIKYSEDAIGLGNKNACLALSNYYIDQYKADLFLNKKYLYKSKETLTRCYSVSDVEIQSKMTEIEKEISVIEKKAAFKS